MEILIAEDEEFCRQLLVMELEDFGHVCHVAENGAQALEIWRDTKPDLILMDMLMPVMDGYTAARAIKEEQPGEHVPIIFLTALSDEEELVQSLEVGDDFLVKPINFNILRAKIQAHERTLNLNRQVLMQNKELEYFRSRVHSEYDMTRHLMEAAQKANATDVPGIDMHCTAASFFSGDLVLLQDKWDGGAYFLIGDFTGHGLTASIGSIPVTQAFRTMSRRNLSVGEIVRELNQILKRFLPGSMFFCATVGEINQARNRIEIWCGGLPDAFLIEGNEVRRSIKSTHMPLGIMGDDEFEADTEILSLNGDNRLLFYTDGVTECSNADGEMFGEEGVISVVQHSQGRILDAMLQAVYEFNSDLQDDLSLIEITCMEKGIAADDGEEVDNINPLVDIGLPSVSLEFSWWPTQLRTSDPLMIVRQWLSQHMAIRPEKEVVFMVIAELFNNAVDHGVLNLFSDVKSEEGGFEKYYKNRQRLLQDLKDGWVRMELTISSQLPMSLCVEVSDSGQGISPLNLDLEDSDDAFGRGLPMVKAICRELKFNTGDHHVRAVIDLNS
ncbi:serine/threonine protein phosphatase [Hahella sp. CCB-MM4]|uniref:ATP-binding SpoIIE family protein phosphatase n=1 Tax=Hahella sp. (strain CCB-MM4) TaxID=1926491 RepID=UPI000B9C3622|nr:fused response regulator/phosphatase [Hahella sp. CCB-MM4]OZG75293.1 serine/threonine protein phosphatase [Hahella sp. CCB-MM4]